MRFGLGRPLAGARFKDKRPSGGSNRSAATDIGDEDEGPLFRSSMQIHPSIISQVVRSVQIHQTTSLAYAQILALSVILGRRYCRCLAENGSPRATRFSARMANLSLCYQHLSV
jgi:hypothetical protein